jgi:hypothetical protein
MWFSKTVYGWLIYYTSIKLDISALYELRLYLIDTMFR